MSKIKFYTHYPVSDAGVQSRKIPGFRYTRRLPNANDSSDAKSIIGSKINLPDCPAIRAKGIDPTKNYDLNELVIGTDQVLFNSSDYANRASNMMVGSSRDEFEYRWLKHTKGRIDYSDYFDDSISYFAQANYSAAFSAKGLAEEGVEQGTLNFKDENLSSIPASFSRSSEATYVGKDNRLQTAVENEPRIDWINGIPELLIERGSTNYNKHSEDLSVSNYTKHNISVSDGGVYLGKQFQKISPTNVSADTNWIRYESNRGSETIATVSFYAKSAGFRYVEVGRSSVAYNAIFDLEEGTVRKPVNAHNPSSNDASVLNATIKHVGNGVYYCTYTQYTVSVVVFSIYNTIGEAHLTTVDGVSGVEICMINDEDGISATSYIPTNGSIRSRSADSLTLAGIKAYLNSEEFTIVLNAPNSNGGTVLGDDSIIARNSSGDNLFAVNAIQENGQLSLKTWGLSGENANQLTADLAFTGRKTLTYDGNRFYEYSLNTSGDTITSSVIQSNWKNLNELLLNGSTDYDNVMRYQSILLLPRYITPSEAKKLV